MYKLYHVYSRAEKTMSKHFFLASPAPSSINIFVSDDDEMFDKGQDNLKEQLSELQGNCN